MVSESLNQEDGSGDSVIVQWKMSSDIASQEDDSGDSVIGHWKNGQECVRLEMQEKEDNRNNRRERKDGT